MKKLLVVLLCLLMFAGTAMPAFACMRHHRHHSYYARHYRGSRYARTAYYGGPRRAYYDYGYRDRRSFWQRHRDKLTVAMGTGGGALIGGLAGGKKGAAIGALAGAGGSALYTYKLRRRHRRY